MRRVLAYLIATLAGAAIGLGSALAMAGLWPGASALAFGNVEVDGWRSDFTIGSETADPYIRARIARHGLLALAKSEAVYFTRAVDDTGQPLNEACRYRLAGGPMPAGWWSVTLYDAASMLPINDDNALSIDASRAGSGRWEAVIAPLQAEGAEHWISSRNAQTFDLTLRLYLPEPALLADPVAALTPPTIERLDCEGAA
ncbi:MAG: hypothetical protein HLUCCX21_01970 [Porphyrobacter sp. HL-46]|nr:MAG: hypothetical protein HLUCCX21_01970 [Porphyrobacter sp. HL-46]